MQRPDTHSKLPGQRLWRKGERAKISIFQTFRSTFEEGDARVAATTPNTQDQAQSARSRARRDGVDDATLRRHIETDLNTLLNTIQLGSALDLSDVPHVQSSIINYGVRCLAGVSIGELDTPRMRDTIRRSLIDHEPRLIPGTIEVGVLEAETNDSTKQRLAISVSAELTGDPVDLALNFDAEIDVSAGKLKMSNLRVQS